MSNYSKWELHARQKQINRIFSGRRPLSDDEFFAEYFQTIGASKEVAVRVRRVPAEVLETDLSQINSLDDFSKNLAFFWEWDSMADVDAIVALEKEFGVSFSDEEAESMKTMKDIVIAVHQKLRLSDQR